MRDQGTIVTLEGGQRLVDRYELVEVLGRGAMGVVWLACDQGLEGREVAIKLLPAALSTDRRSIARLRSEAARNLDLTFPNIVRVHHFDQDAARQGIPFLVMQYIKGSTLNDLLGEHPEGLRQGRALELFEKIGEAIDFAHERGVLHRDIKPGNIMIEEGLDTPYLMDFGIGREVRDTMTRVSMNPDSSGTLVYMSPQQLIGKNHPSNDIYAFAATLYEAISGIPPFHTGDIHYQIRSIEPEPIPGVEEWLNNALLRALAKEIDDRPASCKELFAERKRVVVGVSEKVVGRLTEGSACISPEVVEVVVAPKAIKGRLRSKAKTKATQRKVEFAHGVTGKFVLIDPLKTAPHGFLMGSPADEKLRSDDEQQQRVRLTEPYWLQTTLVSQNQWTSLMTYNRSGCKRTVHHPVDCVSSIDVHDFIGKLRDLGVPARLPTEAEWEFACRAGTTTPFSCGETISTDLANYKDGRTNGPNGRSGRIGQTTTPVATLPANPWGLHDMHGNLWEWCEDRYEPRQSGRPTSTWGLPEPCRVLRGGSWSSPPEHLRSASRTWASPFDRNSTFGFRLALDHEP